MLFNVGEAGRSTFGSWCTVRRGKEEKEGGKIYVNIWFVAKEGEEEEGDYKKINVKI